MKHIFGFVFRAFVFLMAYLMLQNVLHAAPASYSAFTVKVSGKGQPVILIPGATCSGDEWNETVAHYSAKYQCHVLTLAGYAGTAPLPQGPYLETIKKQIQQYIADQKLNNVILIGHSIGGFLSLCIATEMKANLQKVIVVDAMPFFAGANNSNAPDKFTTEQAEKLLDHYNAMNYEQMKKSQLGTAKFLCRDSTHWDQIAEWGARSDKKTFAYTITEMFTNDMRKAISAIKVPILVLAAYCAMPEYPSYSRDMVTEMYKNQYAACTACDVHVAPDKAKHFIMYDNPEWYFSEIDNFMKK